MTILYLAIAAGVTALAFALVLAINVLRQDQGSETIQFIGRAIQDGAMAFLSREYRMLAIFVVFMFVILAVFIDFDVTDRVGTDRSVPSTAIAYLAGAIGSALAGLIGMSIAVQSQHAHYREGHGGTQFRPSRRIQQRHGDGNLGGRDRADRHNDGLLDLSGHFHSGRFWVRRLVDSPVREGGRRNLHKGSGTSAQTW